MEDSYQRFLKIIGIVFTIAGRADKMSDLAKKVFAEGFNAGVKPAQTSAEIDVPNLLKAPELQGGEEDEKTNF